MEIPQVVSGEKYNLKWNRHHNIIATNVLEHLSEEELVDVTLSCEGKFIRAHKLILSASSQYFKELFQRHKDRNPIIIMTNIRFEYLKYIIDYIYKGEIKLLSSEIQGILNLANELQIKGLCGILNKSVQQLTDIKQDKKSSPKHKKANNKTVACHDKPNVTKKTTGTDSDSLNIIIESGVKNKSNSSDINSEKKRESECNIIHDGNKKRKILESKRTTVHEINLSGIFRPILSKPENMEAAILRVKPKVEPASPNDGVVPSPIVLNLKEFPKVLPEDITNNISTDCETKLRESSNVSSQTDANSADFTNGMSQEPDTSKNKQLEEIKLKTNSNRLDDPKPTDSLVNKPSAVKQISAFMLFADEYRPILSIEYPNESVKQISLRLSSMWKNLPVRRKDSYYEEASKANEKLKRKIKA